MRRIVLLFPLCWVFLACCRQYGHFPRKVDVAEIAGFWRLSDDSVRLLDREVFVAGDGKTCNINLLVSGECEFSSYSTAERKIIHEKGVWRVEHNALIGPDERVTNLVTISFAGQRTADENRRKLARRVPGSAHKRAAAARSRAVQEFKLRADRPYAFTRALPQPLARSSPRPFATSDRRCTGSAPVPRRIATGPPVQAGAT